MCAQVVFMGMFQLTRLYLCFSNDQVHGKNGYPQWVFVVMVSLGVLYFVSGVSLSIMAIPHPSSCGFRSGPTFVLEYRSGSLLFFGPVCKSCLGICGTLPLCS